MRNLVGRLGGITKALGGSRRRNIVGNITGPVRASFASVDPSIAQEGVLVTRTQGAYAPRGGGTVAITASEFRIGGVQVGTGATYTPLIADVGMVLSYFEAATETGGTSDGSISTTVSLGAVLPEGGVETPAPWIMETGFWNDDGVWDDAAVWKDYP